MDILYKSFFNIDYEKERIASRDIPDGSNAFIVDLITHIQSSTIVRRHKTRSEKTQVVSCAIEIVNLIANAKEEIEVDVLCEQIANRLLRKEIEVQDRINRLNQKVQKGSLVLSLLYLNDESTYKLIISKVEHQEYMDEIDLAIRQGFPTAKKGIWKSCILDIKSVNENWIIDGARIYLDRQVKYWADDFLELDEEASDESNTHLAFKAINIVLNKLKKDSRYDYNVLRNSIIGHLRGSQQINYDDMINSLLDEYEPANISEEQKATLKEELLGLPNKKGFDSQFNAVPEAIKAKIVKNHKVAEGIELKITYIENIEDKIEAIEDDGGLKYLKIRTTDDETFKTFKR